MLAHGYISVGIFLALEFPPDVQNGGRNHKCKEVVREPLRFSWILLLQRAHCVRSGHGTNGNFRCATSKAEPPAAPVPSRAWRYNRRCHCDWVEGAFAGFILLGTVLNPPPDQVVFALEDIPAYSTLSQNALAVDAQTLSRKIVLILGVIPPWCWFTYTWLRGFVLALAIGPVNALLLKLVMALGVRGISNDPIATFVNFMAAAGVLSALLAVNYTLIRFVFGAMKQVVQRAVGTVTAVGTLALAAVGGAAAAGAMGAAGAVGGTGPGGSTWRWQRRRKLKPLVLRP